MCAVYDLVLRMCFRKRSLRRVVFISILRAAGTTSEDMLVRKDSENKDMSYRLFITQKNGICDKSRNLYY